LGPEPSPADLPRSVMEPKVSPKRTQPQRDATQALGALDLTPSRAHLLWELGQRGPVTQQVLAALRVTPRAMTGLVDALVASGLVTREPHPNDRRAALDARSRSREDRNLDFETLQAIRPAGLISSAPPAAPCSNVIAIETAASQPVNPARRSSQSDERSAAAKRIPLDDAGSRFPYSSRAENGKSIRRSSSMYWSSLTPSRSPRAPSARRSRRCQRRRSDAMAIRVLLCRGRAPASRCRRTRQPWRRSAPIRPASVGSEGRRCCCALPVRLGTGFRCRARPRAHGMGSGPASEPREPSWLPFGACHFRFRVLVRS
jgi:hypothetical protein